jgi:hypothetical protein
MAAQVWEENAQEGRYFRSNFYAVPKMGHLQIQERTMGVNRGQRRR